MGPAVQFIEHVLSMYSILSYTPSATHRAKNAVSLGQGFLEGDVYTRHWKMIKFRLWL